MEHDKPFECLICDNRYKRKDHLVRHVRNSHRELGAEDLWKEYNVTVLHCPHCEQTFQRQHHLKRHVKIHQRDRLFQCLLCASRFLRNEHLQKHYQVHVEECPTERTCLECKLLFSSSMALEMHQSQDHHLVLSPKQQQALCNQPENSTTTSKDYCICDICGEVFTNDPLGYSTHVSEHTEKYPYECIICCRRFETQRGMQSHDHNTMSIVHLESRIEQLYLLACTLSNQVSPTRNALE